MGTELFGNLALGLATAATLQNLLYCFVGVLLGTLIGVLPGIGPVLAQRIIDDRTINGPYRDVAELTRVPGISEKLIDDIRTQITVGP